MKRLGLAVIFLVLSVGFVRAYSSPGRPTGYVNDFAGVLSSETKQQLETEISSLEASNSAQIAVVTIKSLDGDTIENYAVKLFQDWGIGQKNKDNGVLLLVAMSERKIRIEVGYGLEDDLTDAQSSLIIRNIITPAFKTGDYNKGVLEGTRAIISAIKGDAVNTTYQPTVNRDDIANWVMMAIFFGMPVLIWFISVLSRTKSWWLGGVIGAVAGMIFWGLIGLLLLGLFGLLLDWLVSKEYKKSVTTNHYPWWIGGRSGFGGGFGGFGGFGGGRSGGGGSSGRW